MLEGVEHRECLPNRHSCQPPSEVRPFAVARVGCHLEMTRLSAAVRAVRLTWMTCWLLLDGDSAGRPLQTLPGKAEAKDRGTGTNTLIMLVSKNVVAAGA